MDELRSKLIDRLAFLVILYTAVWKVIKRDDGIKKLINRKKNKKELHPSLRTIFTAENDYVVKKRSS